MRTGGGSKDTNSSARKRGLRAQRVDDGRWLRPAPGHVVDRRQQREVAAPAALVDKSPTNWAACQSGSFMPSKSSASRRAHFASAGSSTESFAKALARTRPAARRRRQHQIAEAAGRLEERRPLRVAQSGGERAWISTRPARIKAARAFGPATASAKPDRAERYHVLEDATQSSTPARSSTVSTRNAGLAKTRAASAAVVSSSAPTVASANSPRANDP